MRDWLEGCSETRSYRTSQAWTFRLHLGRLGKVSLSCPTNRGDELIYPAQGVWADTHIAGLSGLRRVHEGYFEVERSALAAVELACFADAELVYRAFTAHDLSRLPEILAQREHGARGEAYSVARRPHDVSFGLSLSRRASDWIVYGVWAVDGEPKNYASARADFFEAYPDLAQIEAVAEAVGPQRHIPIAAPDAERVILAFGRTPTEDFSYATASWTLVD